jgi:hypothetical protein
MSKVGDHAAKDERPRIASNYKVNPEFTNSKGQAKAAKMREKNRKKGR